MIVQCTNCRAKFRIADEKVPDKGAKVRCPKCATVFRAMREGTQAPPGADGAEIPQLIGKPTQPPVESAQLNDALRDALAAARPSAAPPQEKVVPQAPPSASLTYGAGASSDAIDIGMDLPPPPIPMSLPTPPPLGPPGMLPAPRPAPPPVKLQQPTTPLRGLTPTQEQASAWNANALDAALDAAMSSAAAERAGSPPAAQGLPDLSTLGLTPRPEKGRPILSAPPPLRMAPAPALAPSPSSLDLDLDLGPPPAEIPPATMPPPAATGAMAPAPGPPPAFLAPVQPRVNSPFAPAPAADPNDIWAELSMRPAREETDPFAGLNAARPHVPGPTIAMSGPSPAVIPADTLKPVPSPLPPSAGQNMSEELGDVPGAPVQDLGRIPTSAREIELREASMGQKLDLDLGFGQAEFAQRPTHATADLGAPADASGIELGRFNPRSIPPPAASRSGTNPTARKERMRRDFAAGFLNVASASLVLYALIIGVAVIRTPRPVGIGDLGFPMVWLALGEGTGGKTADQLRTTSVHSGIYPVNTGDDLFYVEGMAQNDSSAKLEKMSVTLEIRRGSHVVNEADAVVGLRATPEDLYDLSTRKNEDLQLLLAKRAPSLVVEPYKSAPFVGVFPLHASDVAGSDIRVIVHGDLTDSLKSLMAGGPKHAEAEPAPVHAPAGDAPKAP